MARHPVAPVLGVLGIVMLLGLSAPAAVDAQIRGHLYVSVVGRDGIPVLGLTEDDFVVSVRDRSLTVVSCDLDAAPLKVALLVDNSNVMYEANADTSIRAALTAFLDTLAPSHEIGFFTIARNLRRRTDFTTDRAALRSEVDTVFADRGAGARMMDGLFEVWEDYFTPDDVWPVFVLVLTDGSELSGYVSDGEYNTFVNDLIQRGASVHAVLFTRQGSLNRLGDVQTQYSISMTDHTGGLYRSINAATGLSVVLTEFANHLNAQFEQASTRYRLEIEVPEELSASGISVEVNRPEVALQIFSDRRLRP